MIISVTTDLKDFGYRELGILADSINAWLDKGLPEGFEENEVHPMFNLNSGYVFFTNSEHQVAMMNGEELESFYNCPECGHEGFFHEMDNEGKECCSEYVREARGL